MRAVVVVSVSLLLAAAAAGAQDLYFTATAGNQIWVASRDGSGTPTVLFSNAVAGSQGPAGLVAVLDTTQKLFYGGGNYHQIYAANIDGTGTPAVLWDDGCCEHLGVTVDAGAGVLYWTTESDVIRRGNMNGSGAVSDVFTGLPAAPVGISIDPAAAVLYWTSVDGDVIVSGNADGTGTPTVLFDSADGVNGPRQIVADATNDLVYWTQHGGGGTTGQIMVGNADGSGTPTVLFTIAQPYLPYGIDVDVAAGTLYWVEFQYPPGTSTIDRIMSGNADGSGTPTELHSGIFGSVRGIAAAANLVPVQLQSLSVD